MDIFFFKSAAKAKGAKAPAKAPTKGKAEKPKAKDPKETSQRGQYTKKGQSMAGGERVHLPVTKQVVAPDPASEGDTVEYKHPQHGRITRGRVTAVGQHGVTVRGADGAATTVPHANVQKTLPQFDFGQDPDATPADAKAAFLAPTQKNGIPATPLQLAMLDTAAQYGVEISEDDLATLGYDDAKQLLLQVLSADEGDGSPLPGPDDDEQSDGDDTDDDAIPAGAVSGAAPGTAPRHANRPAPQEASGTDDEEEEDARPQPKPQKGKKVTA